jgi:hypothetical protein
LQIAVLRIRDVFSGSGFFSFPQCGGAVIISIVDPDPELFAGSGLGSGINHFGSGSGQSGSGMNLILNFSVKK